MHLNSLVDFFHAKYKTWYVNLFIAIILSLIIFLLQMASLFQRIESKTVDYRFQLFPIAAKADSNIVLVAIDDNTLREIRRNRIAWPLAREHYTNIVNYMANEGAKAVIFDMPFDEPDYDRVDISAEMLDQEFAISMLENEKVVIGMQLVPGETPVPEELSKFSLVKTSDMILSKAQNEGVVAPLPQFLDCAAKVGVTNIQSDKDGVIRRVPLLYQFGQGYYPQLGYSAWMLSQPNQFGIPPFEKMPFDKQGNYLINWYGSAGVGGAFKYVSFTAVLQDATGMLVGQIPQVPEDYFRDKYVIIGTTAHGLSDPVISPYSLNTPGMEIWGTVLSNLLHHDFIHIIPAWIDFLLLVIVSFLVLFLYCYKKNKWKYQSLLLLLISIIAFNLMMWANGRYLLNLVSSLLAFLLAYLYCTIVERYHRYKPTFLSSAK